MQPARIKPHAKEHTNNPVQKPNFRGHAAGDGEVTRAGGSQMAAPTGKGTPTDDHSRRPETLQGRQWSSRTSPVQLPKILEPPRAEGPWYKCRNLGPKALGL